MNWTELNYNKHMQIEVQAAGSKSSAYTSLTGGYIHCTILWDRFINRFSGQGCGYLCELREYKLSIIYRLTRSGIWTDEHVVISTRHVGDTLQKLFRWKDNTWPHIADFVFPGFHRTSALCITFHFYITNINDTKRVEQDTAALNSCASSSISQPYL
jgi:hypothetical protein